MKFLSLFGGVGGFELGIKRATSSTEEAQGERDSQSWSNSTYPNGESGTQGRSQRTNDTGGFLSGKKTENLRGCSSDFEKRQDRLKSWECVGYYEIDKYSVQTYNKNFGTSYTPTDITKVGKFPKADLIVAGFPCQSFSIAGKRKGFNDTRGTLFYEILRAARDARPHLLLLENVKGLLSHDGGETFRRILECLDELGYDAEWQVLNSKDHGVPQNRERVFIKGHTRTCTQDCKQIFPIGKERSKDSKLYEREGEIAQTINTGIVRNQSDGQYVNVADFRNDEGLRVRKKSISPTLTTRNHSETDISTMPPLVSQALQTDGMLRQGSSWGTNDPQSSRNIRRLTPLECERLQGFPDRWTEGVSDTQRYKQMGNAVTVNVIDVVIRRLVKG